jgi:hypothetical protein
MQRIAQSEQMRKQLDDLVNDGLAGQENLSSADRLLAVRGEMPWR